MSRVHVAMPTQADPLQPANTEPADASAVSVTLVPELKPAEHVEPQLMPAGELVTVPPPAPILLMDNVCCAGGGAGPKLAVTACELVSVSVQPPVPEHAPPQPVNTL